MAKLRMPEPKGILRLDPSKAPVALALCLGVAIFARIAQMGFSLHHAGRSAADVLQEARIHTVRPPVRTVDAGTDVDRVVAAHLFGASSAAATEEATPETFHWVLSGIIEGSTPEEGLAIIGDSPRSGRLRAVGQEVAPGFKLAQVFADRVTIDGHGQRLALRLPRTRSASSGQDLAGAAVTLSAGATQKLPKGIWHPAKGQIAVPLPAEAMLKPQQHHDSEGHYNGIQVTGLDSWVSPLGLQRSDVITQIDGSPITSEKAARQALQQMSSGSAVMLTVERAGVQMQVPLTISEGGG